MVTVLQVEIVASYRVQDEKDQVKYEKYNEQLPESLFTIRKLSSPETSCVQPSDEVLKVELISTIQSCSKIPHWFFSSKAREISDIHTNVHTYNCFVECLFFEKKFLLIILMRAICLFS